MLWLAPTHFISSFIYYVPTHFISSFIHYVPIGVSFILGVIAFLRDYSCYWLMGCHIKTKNKKEERKYLPTEVTGYMFFKDENAACILIWFVVRPGIYKNNSKYTTDMRNRHSRPTKLFFKNSRRPIFMNQSTDPLSLCKHTSTWSIQGRLPTTRHRCTFSYIIGKLAIFRTSRRTIHMNVG